MAMATQASLFTPTLSTPKPGLAAPWNQPSILSFTSPKSTKLSVAPRPIRTAATEGAVEAPVGFCPPELDPSTPSPIFGGSTRRAPSKGPSGRVLSIMRQGPNLLKLARKEQCLALGTRLRSKYKIKYQFYRVFPNGEVQYLHPKDGVYPEKVNPGRQGVGLNMRSIGKNASPIEVKFTGKQVYDL
ncbi:photosystem I subunit D-1 [Actinidia rufa]|uniref:Photosystem I reaction center subunit II, chloroplastic n=1 Tax=Actinidia rufa TaxID=165716 RepID=A0A7J0EF20_9ERIC|nr:photosystem I subunit D-1 [Actinidia rufa]